MRLNLYKSCKTCVLALLVMGSVVGFAIGNEELPAVNVPQAKDLVTDSTLAHQQQKPILLFFSMDGCAWCRYVEEEHLKPMLRNAGYQARLIIRRVKTDDYSKITDFDGRAISGSNLATRYGASLTPTVILVDHNGKLIAPRLLGVSNTEMYGGDLDEAINHSLRSIQQPQLATID